MGGRLGLLHVARPCIQGITIEAQEHTNFHGAFTISTGRTRAARLMKKPMLESESLACLEDGKVFQHSASLYAST